MKITHYGLAVALFTAGCGLADDDSIEHELLEAEPPLGLEFESEATPVSFPPPPPGAPLVTCPGARIIGVLDSEDQSCDLGGNLPPNWEWQEVFVDGSPTVATLGAPPGDLGRYCFFQRESPPTLADEYNEMFQVIHTSGTMPVTSVAADCMGEATQADLNAPNVGLAVRDAFWANTQRVTAAQLGTATRVPIDVAVLDTVSAEAFSNPLVDPVNEHGLQLGALIGDIMCPGGASTCVDDIYHLLAMPRETWLDLPDWDTGGQHGTQADIALAIYEAVVNWQDRLAAAPFTASPRLVLNLSLGWDRDAADTNDIMRGPSRSLISALEFASCSGALVFVAAGNNPDEGCAADHPGLLAPADFTTRPAPDATQCALMGFPSTSAPGFPVFAPGPRPLVYAVGGVDAHDHPLVNSRVGGQPSLVATGSFGTSEVAPGSFYDALTGTSVSAAVASAAAALIWSFRPDLRPDEVAGLLHASGRATGAYADVVGPGGGNVVRRLSVCSALATACVGAPSCPSSLSCPPLAPAGDGHLGGYAMQVASVLATATIDAITTGPTGVAPTCMPPDLTTLAEPQPEVPVCPYCNIDVPPSGASTTPDDVLSMSIDPRWIGTILSAELITYDNTRTATSFSLGGSVVTSLNDPTSEVTTVTLDAPGTVAATLVFKVADATGTLSQANWITVTH